MRANPLSTRSERRDSNSSAGNFIEARLQDIRRAAKSLSHCIARIVALARRLIVARVSFLRKKPHRIIRMPATMATALAPHNRHKCIGPIGQNSGCYELIADEEGNAARGRPERTSGGC